MKSILVAVISLVSITCLQAQPFGNEWIDYSAKYYYFPISKQGIYRIDSTTLADAIGAAQLMALDPGNFKLIARGQEIPVYIHGQSDGQFNSADYIEFYARGNDGEADLVFFDDSLHHPNPFYSQINDTIWYYLTWNNQMNLRVQEETDIAFTNYTAAPYYWRELRYTRAGDDAVGYGHTYFYGERFGSLTDPRYGKCSGWMDAQVNLGGTRNIAWPTPGVFASGPPAQAEVRFASQTNAVQFPDHHMRVLYNNSVTVYDTIFDGFQMHKVNFTIPASTIGTTLSFQVRSVNDLVPTPASQSFSVGYGILRYPHTPNLENKSQMRLIIPDQSSQAKFYLNALSFNGSSAVMYDITNHVRIPVVVTGSNAQALIPNTGGDKECYIAALSAIQNITSLSPVSSTAQFTNFNTYTGNYAIIYHPSLYSAAINYAAYRNVTGYNPVLADVTELYHQFGRGIRNHPIAIRNFIDFGINNWPDTLKHLLLFGKSVHANEGRLNPVRFGANLVPSAGARSSDILINSGLNGAGWGSPVATGRIAARTVQEADDYLDKVKTFEQGYQQPELWKKNVAHFHGGSSVSEQFQLSAYLNGFKNTIRDTLTGARVFDFYKSTTAPIQSGSLFDTIKRTIENGTSLLTFFGHAAGSSFDINIDNAASYNNAGKFPFILANSCLVGDIHLFNTGIPTTSEDFVLSPGRGAIGFIASVGLGSASELNTFSGELYRQLAFKNYGGEMGESIRRTMRWIEDNYFNHNYLRFNLQQMNYHGDPALRYYGWEKPDLEVMQGQAWFNPGQVSTDRDSFDLHVVINNKARAFDDVYTVHVLRRFFDNSTDTLVKNVNGGRFSDTIIFRLPVNKFKGGGLNTFTIIVDETSQIDEYSENNNTITLQLNILSEEIIPVWPPDFAVVPGNQVTLKASTGDPHITTRTYRFEADTSALFNSGLKISDVVTGSGGVIRYSPAIPAGLPDSTVWFWRVAKDTTAGNHRWKNNSFQIITGKEGWGQAHFEQFRSNAFTFLKPDTLTRIFHLDTTAKQLICNNIGNPATPVVSYGIEFKIDANIEEYAGCGWSPALHVVVVDSITLQAWGKKWTNNNVNPPVTFNPNHDFGNANNENSCRNRVEKYFIFQTSNPTQMDSMASMLQNHIPDGNYVLVYSYLNNMRSLWTPSLVSAFSALGAGVQLTSISDSLPFIFFVKKGYQSTADVVIGSTPQSTIQLSKPLFGSIPYGKIRSGKIGPALKWNSLYMKHRHLESPSAYSSSVTVYGIMQNGIEVKLGEFTGDDIAETGLENLVAAGIYPYIRIETHKEDDSLRTAPQLHNWQVLYDPAPEFAINPSKHFVFKDKVAQEGQQIVAEYAVTNISSHAADSVMVRWHLEDVYRNQSNVRYNREAPLAADSSFITRNEFSSLGLPGDHYLHIEVNPRDNNWLYEQYHFNNTALQHFRVERDNRNSLLDVTFDGIHILNREIVSPKSYILIQLKDENQYIALDDTADFRIYLKDPDGHLRRLWFHDPAGNSLVFTPAVLPKNSCRIGYQSDLQKDGVYTLSVQARDAARSEEINYEIEFEVVQKSSITQVLNYPNPFSTSTRFVFTLTGSEVPDNFRIQIMTVTGKVVREINSFELGQIRIGRNVTEYAWDGRDQFGDQLANGIYLYRVTASIGGKSIEHRTTEADQFFHRGFGKMYLLRGN